MYNKFKILPIVKTKWMDYSLIYTWLSKLIMYRQPPPKYKKIKFFFFNYLTFTKLLNF